MRKKVVPTAHMFMHIHVHIVGGPVEGRDGMGEMDYMMSLQAD